MAGEAADGRTGGRAGGAPPAPPIRTVVDCINVDEVMALGSSLLPPEVRSYFLAAAGDEETAADNLAAFRRRRLRPRVLADLDGLTTATTVLGRPVTMPIGIAPTAEHGLAHPDGELATARALVGVAGVDHLGPGTVSHISARPGGGNGAVP